MSIFFPLLAVSSISGMSGQGDEPIVPGKPRNMSG